MFFEQSVDSVSNIRHLGQEIISQSVSHHCSSNHVSGNHHENNIDTTAWHTSSEEQYRQDGFLKSFTHPAFPEYSMRYKTPEICDPTVKQISGYLDIESDKHFFFWFFESRNNPQEDPLVLWLNGGPGCSSMLGLLTELGPCAVNEDGSDTILNEYSWNNNASVIFLDQPLNVGYSYGKGGPLDSVNAAKDVYALLQLFFKEFPQYSNLDFHVAGESYGGHYVPAIGSELNRNNKASSDMSEMASTLSRINLKSLLIGNGLTDPLIQYKYYSKYACENSYGPALEQQECDKMDDKYPACAKLIEKCYAAQDLHSCMPALTKCNEDLTGPYHKSGKNPYDVRKDCVGSNLCYDIIDSLETYLNRPDVMSAIGAQVQKYDNCNDEMGGQFGANDWMRPYVNEIAPLLEDGIRILVYAGDADFICNWMGNKAWVVELPWSGHEEFAAAADTAWFSTTANEQGGELRRTKDGRFAFLRIFDSGHMVPMDRGDYALDMLNNWLHEQLA
ncbi:peptidase S10, serine carboxypeptidase, partial [Lichtheimia hyalospora FSU 10163]